MNLTCGNCQTVVLDGHDCVTNLWRRVELLRMMLDHYTERAEQLTREKLVREKRFLHVHGEHR